MRENDELKSATYYRMIIPINFRPNWTKIQITGKNVKLDD